MGSSILASVLREPSERVKRRCWVRSIRAERRALSAIILMPTKRIAAQTRATIAVMERFISRVSIRFLEVDDHGVGEQESADYREEEDRVARVDYAARDRREMGEEAERRDGRKHRLGRP